VDNLRIPDLTWLPTPLAYDSFTRSDGALGNSESSGPDGQTVAARAWTAQSGTWAVSSNQAVATAAGIATLPGLPNGDYVIEAQVTTPASGTTPGGLIVRFSDTSNYWYVKITPGTAGTDLELVEVNDGTPTTRASADVDFAADTEYRISVVCEGDDEWRVFVDDAAELTYTTTNTFNATETVIGLRDEGDDNFKFDGVLVLARGTNGEYSRLERY
jgi:hypothetical protein